MTETSRGPLFPALNRRGLLGGAAGSAGGYALSRVPGAQAARRTRKRRRDVVVIGAGLAGLTAAREVVASGHSVVVLEARRRVGGRTLNRNLGNGRAIEIGGQWVGPTQTRVLPLIDELGLDLYDTYVEGQNIYYRDGAKQRYTGTIPPANGASLVELAVALERLNLMAADVPSEAPWNSPAASEYDGQTFETWKLTNIQTPEARDLFDLAIQSVFSAEPADLSLLFVLFYISAAAGDINLLIDTAGGAQESRIVGGSQLISLRMAEQLGRVIQLDSPVRAIHRQRGRVELRTKRDHWVAKQVINTLPPALGQSIRHFPKLPANRAQLEQRMPMGTVIKCMAVYDEPFWREDGLSGMATSDTGPVKLTFDNTPHQGTPGVLLGFIEGQEAREFNQTSKADRRQAVLESFARYYGSKALNPINYVDKSWSKDRWSRGCYTGFTPPGVLLGYGPDIRQPIGRIHFAGTETATQWAGYMDGAVQSGERAAAEAIADL